METLAYLHIALTHEAPASSGLPILRQEVALFSGLKWQRLSSKAWKYMLPLALNLAVLSVASNVLALERGDRGPAVTTLQEQLKAAGFFDTSPTELYGPITEDAVRRFQAAHSLDVDGVAGPATLQKLQGYRSIGTNAQPNRSGSENLPASDRTSGDTLSQGDRGAAVEDLQKQLSAAGFFNTNPTGTFGPVTEDAVRQFQEAKHLAADGVVGPATRRELEKFGTGGESPQNNSKQTASNNRDILHQGDSGDDVRALQEQLRKAGYFSGSGTGNFGLVTEDAVRRFQAEHDLKASGIAGPTTRSKLKEFLSRGGNPTTVVNRSSNRSRDILHLGDSGNDVRVLQEQLRAAGYFNADPTGTFGPITQDAVKRFQADVFLEASGIAGKTTRGKLQNFGRPDVSSKPKPQLTPFVTRPKPQNSPFISSTPTPPSSSQASVVELQKRLQNLGFYDGPVNGVFDTRTKAAIRGAQRYYGVSEADIQSGRF